MKARHGSGGGRIEGTGRESVTDVTTNGSSDELPSTIKADRSDGARVPPAQFVLMDRRTDGRTPQADCRSDAIERSG